MTSRPSHYEQLLFYGLLALLVWLPLPMGSNRVWAESVFEAWIALLGLMWLVGWYRFAVYPNVKVLSGARVMWWLLGVWLLYLIFMLVPLPVFLHEFLSPESASMYRSAGVDGPAPLSLHSYASFLYWMRSVAYALMFVLLLLLVNSKERLILLAYTLVVSGLFQAFYGSMMTLSGEEYGFFAKKMAYVGYATGTFVNRNHLAGYLEMTLAVGIGLLLASWTSRRTMRSWRQQLRSFFALVLSQKMVLRLILAMLVIALILTRSRMGNTAFFSSMLVAGLIYMMIFRHQAGSIRKVFSKRESRSVAILLSSLMVIDIFLVGAWFGVERVVARIEQSSIEHDADRVEVSMNTLRLYHLTL